MPSMATRSSQAHFSSSAKCVPRYSDKLHEPELPDAVHAETLKRWEASPRLAAAGTGRGCANDTIKSLALFNMSLLCLALPHMWLLYQVASMQWILGGPLDDVCTLRSGGSFPCAVLISTISATGMIALFAASIGWVSLNVCVLRGGCRYAVWLCQSIGWAQLLAGTWKFAWVVNGAGFETQFEHLFWFFLNTCSFLALSIFEACQIRWDEES